MDKDIWNCRICKWLPQDSNRNNVKNMFGPVLRNVDIFRCSEIPMNLLIFKDVKNNQINIIIKLTSTLSGTNTFRALIYTSACIFLVVFSLC